MFEKTSDVDKLYDDLKRMNKPLTVCPHPEKRRFDTREGAERRARYLWQTYAAMMDTYKCACGKFHLTSVPSQSSCPLCGAEIDEFGHTCGCYNDIHYGKD